MTAATMTAETIARLRELMAKVPKGHWDTRFPEAYEANPRSEFTVAFERDGHPNMTERHERWEAMAALISEAHDALPALLRAAESEGRMRTCLQSLARGIPGHCCDAMDARTFEFCEACTAEKAIDAALAPADDERREP